MSGWILCVFSAEESETESKTNSIDKLNECESIQKLASDEDDLNSCRNGSIIDSDGNRYYQNVAFTTRY